MYGERLDALGTFGASLGDRSENLFEPRHLLDGQVDRV
jgi:hypothetical protein